MYYYRRGGVWQVPVDGGEETQVLESVRAWHTFSVTDIGMYFIPRDEANSVQFLDFNTRVTSTVATLEESIYTTGGLAVSPDGRTILHTQVDTAGSVLMLVEDFR